MGKAATDKEITWMVLGACVATIALLLLAGL